MGEEAAAAGTAEPQLCPVCRAGMGIWAGGGEAMQSGRVTPGGGTGRERAASLLSCCAVIGVRVPGKVRDTPAPLL